MQWIIDNAEWVFSGIGVFVLSGIVALISKNKKAKVIKMKQKSGNNSTNIQIGGNYNGR